MRNMLYDEKWKDGDYIRMLITGYVMGVMVAVVILYLNNLNIAEGFASHWLFSVVVVMLSWMTYLIHKVGRWE